MKHVIPCQENYMQKKLLYLSGPMTGIKDLNRQAFMDAEHRLRALGFAVINPHDVPLPDLPADAPYDELWAKCLALDIWVLVKTNRPDALVLLAGWQKSRGSLLEAAVCRRFGIPVYTYGQVLMGELSNATED